MSRYIQKKNPLLIEFSINENLRAKMIIILFPAVLSPSRIFHAIGKRVFLKDFILF